MTQGTLRCLTRSAMNMKAPLRTQTTTSSFPSKSLEIFPAISRTTRSISSRE